MIRLLVVPTGNVARIAQAIDMSSTYARQETLLDEGDDGGDTTNSHRAGCYPA